MSTRKEWQAFDLTSAYRAALDAWWRIPDTHPAAQMSPQEFVGASDELWELFQQGKPCMSSMVDPFDLEDEQGRTAHEFFDEKKKS